MTFSECSLAPAAKTEQLDALIESAWSVLQDELSPPDHGLYYAPLDLGVSPLDAVVSARARTRFGRLVYKDLFEHKDCDPKLVDHEFFTHMCHGYGSLVVPQVRVADTLPIDCIAGDNYSISGMDLALCTASVHETEDGKTR